MTDSIALQLKSLPEKPGVYRFLDENGVIIYIGKAKVLKKRVSSYFTKTHDDYPKLRILVPKIRDIQFTVVDSEWEALLLENSMIKQFRPRYNAMLKDDKSYPWLAVSKEEFPRLYYTRNPNPKKEELFGPYASLRFMHTLLNTLLILFPIRICKVLQKNERPCLQYHIKKCAAPCAGFISPEEYKENIQKIIKIIKGNHSEVLRQLKAEMMHFAETWEFEKAQTIKEKIETLESYRGKSVVVNPEISYCDVFSIEEGNNNAFVNFMRIVEGAIVQTCTLEIQNNLENSKEELLLMAMAEIEKRFGLLSHEIIIPFHIGLNKEKTNFTVPVRGDKKKLLELSQKNAKISLLEKQKRQELADPERHQTRILLALQKDLEMANIPKTIECFDNSNTQGDEPVGAMVHFKNGKPDKKEYRHFIIKTVIGPDDFASMYEVVKRRYSRLVEEKKPLPDLVIIDGGKGQLNAAHQALTELNIQDKIMLIGIAKRLEDIYKVGESLPVFIDKKSESQKLLQRIRDEVHRFGITHHRKRRSKKSIHSELDDIKGIGTVTKEKLLKHFKSVAKIKAATFEELAAVIGDAKAKLIR
ncbi:MAG: excinuclease ABC subunit UvrC [Bacteroidetes bacterium]|nr:excinuclease ABC subunit UvrC [Bacteroidota bacterium]MCL2302839.1 excinuclease ABC subunit UvrC [Lentimicrobiaceae bacterium]